MKLEFEISNNPLHSGVKRKIVLKNNPIHWELDFSEMNLTVYYFREEDGGYGEPLDTYPGFAPTHIVLKAGSDKVDPVTGVPVERIYYDADDNVLPSADGAVRSELPPFITDFEYFKNIKPSSVGMTADHGMAEILVAIYEFVIQRRDQAGKFN